MHVYEEEHTDVDEKLYDLKNILIKYIRGESMSGAFQEIIFELFRLEKDIQDHTRIENNILLPLVEEMEDALFYPAEHSRRYCRQECSRWNGNEVFHRIGNA